MSDTTRDLVLSGGGPNGVFQVAALRHLVCDLGRRYDRIWGTSVGALNGAYVAQYGLDEQVPAVMELEALWRSIKGNADIYRPWCWGLLGDLPALWKPSRWCSEGLRRWIRREVDLHDLKTTNVRCEVVAVRLGTSQVASWKITGNIPNVDPHLAIEASASYTGLLEPVCVKAPDHEGTWESGLWTDGGIRDTTPLEQAIEAKSTAVDVVICSPENPRRVPLQLPATTIDVALDGVDAALEEVQRWDVHAAALINELVLAGSPYAQDMGYRLVDMEVWRPSTRPVPGLMQFDPQLIATALAEQYAHVRRESALRGHL